MTGGAGFIGTNFIHYLFKNKSFEGIIVNVDTLTYAGNLKNLKDVDRDFGGERYFLEKSDINDFDKIKAIFDHYEIDAVVHFAAVRQSGRY